MEAVCRNCRNSWELQKAPDDYKDGPRCPVCKSRDVDIDEASADADTAQVVFEALHEGKQLVDLVHQEGIDPDEVENLAETYARLSDYELVSSDEMKELREEAFKEGRENGYAAGLEDGKAEGKQQVRETELDDVRDTAFDEGYWDGWDEGYEAGKQAGYADGREDGFEEAREEFDDHITELKDSIQETTDEMTAALEAAEQRGYDRGRAETAQQSWARGWEAGYTSTVEPPENEELPAVYADGLRQGILLGIEYGIQEGKSELIADIGTAMSS